VVEGSEKLSPQEREIRRQDLERRLYAYYGEIWGLSRREVDTRFSPSQRDFYYLQYLEGQQEAIDRQIIAVTRAVGSLFSKDLTSPYVSKYYQALTHRTAKAQREFPYDVRFLPAVQVHQLVAHSVQYRITQAVLDLAEKADLLPAIRQDLLALQRPRYEGDFRVRGWFTEAAMVQEIRRVTGDAFVDAFQENIIAATQRFPRLADAVWTPDRGRAAIGEDIVTKRAAQSAFLWEKYQELQRLGKTFTLHQLQLWREMEVCQDRLTVPARFVDNLHLSGSDRQVKAQEVWNQRLGTQQIQEIQQQMRGIMQALQASYQDSE
jgi:hypothetical protein